MKKIYKSFVILSIAWISNQAIYAQQSTIIGNPASTTFTGAGHNGGPIFRSSAVSPVNNSKHNMLYSASDISSAGILTGSPIDTIGWFKNNAFTLASGRSAIFRVYMKNSNAAGVVNSTTYSAATTGSVLVYEDTNVTNASFPAIAGYWKLPLIAPFIYSGGAIEIQTEWQIRSGSGSAATGLFAWQYTLTSPNTLLQAQGTSSASALTNTAILSTTHNRIMNLYVHFTPAAAPCSGTPNAGLSLTSNSLICPNDFFTLNTTGSNIFSGISYQWQSSSTINGPYSNILNATSLSLQGDSISAITYYRCLITCSNSGISSSSVPVVVNVKPLSQCYCNTTLGGDCLSFIDSVALNTLNNPINFCNLDTLNQAYTVFPDSANFTTSLVKGLSYFFSIKTSPNPQQIAAFIDYDKDGFFNNTNERINVLTISGTINRQNIFKVPITIPLSADTGKLGLRIRVSQLPFNNACDFINVGETEDYTIRLINGVACSSFPNAVSVMVSDTSVCSGTVVNFEALGNTLSSGLSYQWQLNGVNIPGATSNILVEPISGPNTYRCVVTCLTSGQSVTSNPITFTINPVLSCYCQIPSIVYAPSNAPNIGNITIGTFTNGGPASPIMFNTTANRSYTDFTNLGPIPLLSGVPNQIKLAGIFGGPSINPINYYVYIDYNQDGTFDPLTEMPIKGNVDFTVTNSNVILGNAILPSSALSGITRMRIAMFSFDSLPNSVPCDNPLSFFDFTFGEVEDYLVNIQPAPICSAAPIAGLTIASDTTVCIGQVVNFGLIGTSLQSGLNYQWKRNGVNLPGQTLNVLSDTITGLSTYQCVVTCVNSGISATSGSVALSINPFIDCYCKPSPLTISSTINRGFGIGYDIGNVSIGSFTNGNPYPPAGNSSSNNIYTNFTNLGPIPLFSGISNSIRVSLINSYHNFDQFSQPYTRAFIDYNHDGVFDPATELALYDDSASIFGIGILNSFGSNGNNNYVISDNLIIPNSALSGVTGMRILVFDLDDLSGPCDLPALDLEIEDYLVDIQPAVACTGAPIAGSIMSTDTTICSSDIFTLSLNNAFIGTGLSYQWYINNTLLPNDTLPILLNTSQNANKNYSCKVTCVNSGLFSISTPLTVLMNPPATCICVPVAFLVCDPITFVGINGGVNVSSNICVDSIYISSINHKLYASPIMTANPGDSTLCIFGHDTVFPHPAGSFTDYINMWIDYNDDLVFSNTENVIVNLFLPDTIAKVGTHFIASSDTGRHLMRVTIFAAAVPIPYNSCDTIYTGTMETEDYYIDISDTVTTVTTALSKPINKSNNFKVKFFPNPTSGILNYEIPSATKSAQLKVSDLLGRTMISKNAINTKTIDLSSLKNGTYFITIDLDGSAVQSKVIVNK
jgi:hypothetical protein